MALVPSVVTVSMAAVPSLVIAVPKASTVTTSSVGVHPFPSTSEVDTSQVSSSNVTMSSQDVNQASPKRGKRKKHKEQQAETEEDYYL